MGRRRIVSFLCFFSVCHIVYSLESQIRSQDKAPHSDTVIHHPSASLSIAGDLRDVKLKSSIDQLVRALQTPPQSSRHHERGEGNNPHLITKNGNVHSPDGKRLFSGASQVPEPITISSQSIRINSNKTGPKKPRSLITSVDEDGVKTIEGIRVPDDEADKFYTWRNARVIKGFLVPNDKSPNPHRKRQVVVHTDPNAYLAAAAAAAQSQGATTIFDSSNGRQGAPVPSFGQGAESYYTAQVAQNPRYQQSQVQQPVQLPHQYQHQLPSASSAKEQTGHPTAFAYAQQQGQQLYVMPDGNTYVQYSPVQAAQTQHIQQQLANQVSHSQIQFSSRSGEPASPTSQQTVPSQVSNRDSHTSASQIQQQIAQAQAAVQAIQQLQQAPAPQASAGGQVSSGQSEKDLGQSVAEVLAAAASGSGSQSQYVVQNPSGSATVVQIPGHNTFSERQFQVQQSQAGSQAQSGFVIKPQTYVTGPGGQTFTIPIPVPADQAGQASTRQEQWYHSQQQQQQQHQQHQPGQIQSRHPLRPHGKPRPSFIERVMESLQMNKKALERMDTNVAVVPALASTGIFLGLSALAAGWYLSKGNREVGIVRRTGKPRNRRDVALPVNNYPQEVDQATFFQSIIQQSLEKTQQQYEDQVEPVYHQAQQESTYAREPEPERRPNKNARVSRPQSREDNDFYKPSKTQYAQEKSGPVTVGSSKNFAKVFIPALILGLSVISITALIFGWYITGANREIAFLEPASYTRKKRSLLGPTALADGWLQRTITALHHNPYDRMPAPTAKSLLPHPFLDKETSKTSDLEFKVSNSGLTGVLAGGALLAIVALGLINSLSEGTSRQFKTGRANPNPSSFAIPNPQIKHLRAPRSLHDGFNDISEAHPNNPGFLSSVLSTIEEAHQSLITSLHDAGLFDPHSSCSKKIICEILASEDDDSIRTTEKRVTSFLNVLPPSVSGPLKETFGEIVSSVNKRDCSAFVCDHRGVGSVTVESLPPVSNTVGQS